MPERAFQRGSAVNGPETEPRPAVRHRAYLALGSNIAPERHLPAAVSAMQEYGKVVAVSRVWQSAPEGDSAQADFLNAAVLLETPLTAAALRSQAIAAVETRLGRVRDPSNRNAPRTIDVDLALFDRDVLELGGRRIPDPDVLTRAFVAVPLADLDPDYVHPEQGLSLSQIAARLRSAAGHLRLRPDVRLLDLP